MCVNEIMDVSSCMYVECVSIIRELNNNESTVNFSEDIIDLISKKEFMNYLLSEYKQSYDDFFKELQREDTLAFLKMENTVYLNKLNKLIEENKKCIEVLIKCQFNFEEYEQTEQFELFLGKTYYYNGKNVSSLVSSHEDGEWNRSKQQHKQHMEYQYKISKRNAIKKIIECTDQQVKHFIPMFEQVDSLLIQSVLPTSVEYIFPVVILHNDKASKFPPLAYTAELFDALKDMKTIKLCMIAQKYDIGKVVAKYTLTGNQIFITFTFETVNGASYVVAIQSIHINKYIYNDTDAVFWNWYGGYIPINYNVVETLCEDTGINQFGNGWKRYINNPVYVGTTGIMYQQTNKIQSTVYEYEYGTQAIESLIIKNRESLIQDFTASITSYGDNTELTKLLDDVTDKYELICTVLELIGENPDKYFNKKQHYSRNHISQHKGMYHTNKINFDHLFELFRSNNLI